ncbi:T9SS type A sorting domain-containing protein [Winogradskyella ursingii]|uniref:T9SS type A sorting domain-containing protein n=1 Tax=Winogradskyella ursingii TaxID=2686079 RepID=UPI0015CD700B|nr:T9SS type A sorting domain-containing protein [Winogradskyella ursingii]
MMKNYYLSLIFLLSCFCFAFGQVKIAEVTFEVPTGYSTSIPEFTDGVRDYFLRTDGTDFNNGANGVLFNNIQGNFYFAAQDIDGESATLPVFLNLEDIDVSGYDNLEFRIHLAEDDQTTRTVTQHWDNSDYVHINYDIDNSGIFTNLLWIENDGSGTNNEPLIDNDFNGDGDGVAITDTFTQFTRNISNTGTFLDIEIEFNLNAGQEDIAIDNIEIWGTFAPCSGTTTWSSTGWDNGVPDINTSAILDFAYNTGINGNINACNLTINNMTTLTVNNNGYVKVKNEINTIGTIIVEDEGAVVQKNNASVNTTLGNITIQKFTTVLNEPVEYTYWSSPVTNETIENVFALVPTDRRYYFDASEFEDFLMEINNSNTFVSGQDDIDDNGNSWQSASGNMLPGLGYAATAANIGMFPAAQQFNFQGNFNNGVILAPLVNDSGGVYNDWNFIGNPYPSAIDTNIFFTTNAGVVDAIYLWNQATPADANASGNDGLNFSSADYAVISASGVNTAGGDLSLIPNDFVPSCQGFFVEALSNSSVIFNNSMRVEGNNNQFFRNTNSTPNNKKVLWLNLKSDNGVATQLAVAHIDGATDGNDGTFYDVKRNASSNVFATLYSTINDESDQFVIQGKDLSSLDIEEVIELGFKTIIDSPTIYSISIAKSAGTFYDNNPIFIKDNLMNTVHNLKESDYNFTSEVGEFEDRFEVVFTADLLSTKDKNSNINALTIVELNDGTIEIKINNNLNLTNVEILDITGRQIYNLPANSSEELYDLSKLSKAAYIARITLSNGQVISKKAIKRH